MAVEIITKEDLKAFRIELLNDLKQQFSAHLPTKPKQWLKSSEVRKILKISPGTLQNLRINNTLRFTKIGGIIYYSNEDIECLLESGIKKENNTNSSLHSTEVRRSQLWTTSST